MNLRVGFRSQPVAFRRGEFCLRNMQCQPYLVGRQADGSTESYERMHEWASTIILWIWYRCELYWGIVAPAEVTYVPVHELYVFKILGHKEHIS